MKEIQFNFNDTSFSKLFPFYILIDKNLNIKSVGESVVKILPDLKDQDYFGDIFSITRPHIENLIAQNFNQILSQLTIVVYKKDKSISFRGQFEQHEDCYLFVGSPWFVSMEDVVEKKLTLHDFAFHDPLLDLLHILKNQDINNAELKELLTTINSQKNELKKANKEIYDIALFPTQNPDPLIRIDFEGNLVKTNPAANNLKFLVFEDINYKIEEFFKKIISQINTDEERWIFEAKSENKYFSFVCKSLKNEGYINIYGRDITLQKKGQEELNKLSLVASANKNGVVFTNPDGTIFWCNYAYIELTGYTFNEIIGKTPVEIGKCENSSKDEIHKMVNAFYKGEPFDVEILHAHKDKSTFWSKTKGQPILDSNGKVVQYFAIIEDISKEKTAEERLLLLSSIAEKNINAVIICDNLGRIEWVNSSFTAMTGFDKSELIGNKPGEILQGDETDQETINYMSSQIKKGLSFNCEIINYTKTGEKYWVRVQGQALHNKNGEIIKYFAIEENITHEKEFNQQLVESENRLKSLIVNLQSGILLEDENRKILIVNKKFCNMFGIQAEPESMKGYDCAQAAESTKHFFKSPDQFLNRIDEILINKEEVIAEEIELVDGSVFERSFMPIIRDQHYAGHLWSYEDITIKKKYKESLEAEREKYSNIIANMNMGLLEVDVEDTIQLANQSFCDMSGYSLLDLLGKKASDLLLESDSKKVVKNKNEERINGSSDSYEVTSKNKNGQERHWLISGAPNFNVNGEVIGSIGIHLDITNQKNLELQKEQLLKKLEKQNEQLNNYAQIVSHDLKSPLRSIHSLISWIKEDNDKEFSEQTTQYLNMIEGKVEKMDHLIQGILTYSKVDTDEAHNEIVSINEIVNNIIDIIHLPENIDVKIIKELPTITADKFRMQQLFQNIIGNAVNYIDKPKGLIEVDYVTEKNHYVFSIKDNGPGIAIENQEKIFNMFQSFTQHERSTGIGLSIVKRIVDNYKGKIWIESELEKGTTFFIKLPKK
ncbi:PAS domain S-box protein [Flavobacterium sp. SUN052]|uniref:PAS domain S-box protein n=1 Tax=Flavobacterium sp. SUN052 TaxID=3002441 RepID=UPI00237EC1B0|nr:PAS domain S-box protein [Flavobacterium sp. SUN052]MEC4003997.1 PAS domain S-box protein [Flavobacterium sp. SUN052]